MTRLIRLKKGFFISFGERIEISIFLVPMFVFSFIYGYGHMLLLAYTFSFLHELAHIFCALFLKVRVCGIRLYPFGICAKLSKGYSPPPEKEFFVAFSGPFFSLVVFWVFSFLNSSYQNDLFAFCMDINLAICFLNLVPALPLDGGRMLKSILSARFGIIRSFVFLRRLSLIMICLLFAFALFLIFVSGFNFSLILISAFLFQNLSFEEQSISMLTLKEIMYSKQKANFLDNFRTKNFCFSEDCLASSLLRHLGSDYFCLVFVMDKDFKVTKVLTETKVIDELLSKGLRIKYKDIKI